jgi:hypothetical protein
MDRALADINLADINLVTVLLAAAFILPLITGAFGIFTREKVRYSLGSLLDGIELAAGLILAVYFTKRIFFEHDGSFFSKIYEVLPEKLKGLFFGRDILAYLVAVPVLLFIMLFLVRLVTTPLYKHIFLPLSDRIYTGINGAGPFLKKLAGGLWQLPKAVALTLAVALLLNFSTYYIYSPALTAWTNGSDVYRLIYDNALYPALNSNLAKKIPVLVSDTFGRAASSTIPQKRADDAIRSFEKLTGGRVKIIEYFNGVTLDEAIKSNESIDETAEEIVGKESDDRKKAYLIYKWIAQNIEYDYEKAAYIAVKPERYSSGSIEAFETGSGICFDYSCLFVTMCRAVGLKSRLITGLGYSGTAWGDHAWNQVWYGAEEEWINVDATFGSAGVNYFDKRDFDVDHRDAELQGEW